VTWQEVTIGTLANVVGGGTPSTRIPEYWAGDIPWFTPAEIPETGAGVVTRSKRSITREGLAKSAAKLLPAGTVLVTSRASIGNCAIAGVPVTTNQGFASLIPKDFRSTRYLYYCVQQNRGKLLSRAAGSTFLEISAPKVREIELLAPSAGEQERIGVALSDADDLIATLERLIAKKQAIKQGMIQQLLTGRTRLPGFASPWSELSLVNVARIKTGSRNNQDKQAGGKYPFFVRSATVERIDSYSYDCEAILVPGEGGIGSIFHYINGKFEVHQRVYKISDFAPNASGRFIYYFMRQYFGVHAMENSVKATVDSLRLPTFKNFQLRLPSRNEQDAIVCILDDAEAEVATLKLRLTKARAIKTGMMQQLLTGRTRLPVEAAS